MSRKNKQIVWHNGRNKQSIEKDPKESQMNEKGFIGQRSLSRSLSPILILSSLAVDAERAWCIVGPKMEGEALRGEEVLCLNLLSNAVGCMVGDQMPFDACGTPIANCYCLIWLT